MMRKKQLTLEQVIKIVESCREEDPDERTCGSPWAADMWGSAEKRTDETIDKLKHAFGK